MSVPELRALGVREILDAGLRLYVRNAGLMLALAAAVVIPLQILVFVWDVSVVTSPHGVPGDLLQTGTTAGKHAAQGAAVLGDVIGRVIATLVGVACVHVANASYLGGKIDSMGSLRFTLGRVGPLVWFTLLFNVGLIVAFLVLVVPGIYLYAAWSVALPVLVIEGLGARASLRRSRALVKGRWWPVAGVILATTVAAFIVDYGFIALVLGVIGRGPTVLSSAAITNAAIAIGAIIVYPFYSTVGTVLYYDLDLRHKDSDAAVATEQPARPEPARRAPLPRIGPPPGESALERIFRRNRN